MTTAINLRWLSPSINVSPLVQVQEFPMFLCAAVMAVIVIVRWLCKAVATRVKENKSLTCGHLTNNGGTDCGPANMFPVRRRPR